MLASFTVFASLFIGLADALAVVDLPAPERQYGALRAHASLSFTVGVVAVGFLYSWAGYGAAPAVFLIWAGALLLLVRRIPDRSADSKRRPKATAAQSNEGVALGPWAGRSPSSPGCGSCWPSSGSRLPGSRER